LTFTAKICDGKESLLRVAAAAQGRQIFLGTKYQNGKNVPNGHKIYQMVTKYNKLP
jgi:hypothetical protein